MRLRRLSLTFAIALFVGVPAALAVTADPFGPVEVADPTWHPATNFNSSSPFVGADASGDLLLGTIFRDSKSNDQFAVLERCGSGPVTWQRTVLTTATNGVTPEGLRVAADGTAMAVWRVSGGGATTHYSAVRAPGGTWGPQQEIVSDLGVGFVSFALGDNGDAVAVWADGTAPAGTRASVRPAGGTWGTAELITGTTGSNAVAMGATGDSVIVYKGPSGGWIYSRYRPAGGAWTAEAEVLRHNYPDTLESLRVEFDGDGRTVALADYREFDDTIRYNVGTGGLWGPTDRTIDDDGDTPAPQYGYRNVSALVRHPDGIVAAWTRWPSVQNTTFEVVVARLNGAAWDTRVFKLTPGAVALPQLAVDAAGEILLAADYSHNNVDDIYASIAPSLTAAWPDLALVSPAAVPTKQFREPFAAGGGPAFAIGWGVHGGSNQRTEVISNQPAGSATCGTTSPPTPTPTATPTATATATVSATPEPQPPLPLPVPVPLATASPTPTPAAPAPVSAIADFTTLPAASTCVRGRKLTLRFKKPPKGYVVKTVTVKVNTKKVATLKGAKLKKPFYLRKLPNGRFTVTVSITLVKGKGLTERRRYTSCG